MIKAADFRPAWWLPGPHLQTLWATLCRRKPLVPLRRERLELPDGDFLDLDWTRRKTGPVVLVLHGLEGSSDSGYARGLLHTIDRLGWRGVVMHFRGCSGEPNRLARSYNAGETGDLEHVITLLRRREPDTPLACVGYSLGGNALLKWLGESAEKAPLSAAVAVSVPFLLACSARRMSRGFSRLYQAHLLQSLHRSYQRKVHSLAEKPPVPLAQLARCKDFYSFDEHVTAPLHGYSGADEYYAKASCRRYLRQIRIPCLILHALDDPFMLPAAVPQAAELAPAILLELSPHGGHVGFVQGSAPWRADYWLERRIPAYLAAYLSP